MYDSYDTSPSYDSYSSYSSTSSADSGAAAAAALIVLGMLFVVFIITYVLVGIFLGKIFKKAGSESWAAWVPFYNTWKLLQLGGQQGFWAILAILPLINIVSAVFTLIAMYNVGLKLQKGAGFLVLAFLFPLVWIIWLGVDSSTWDESKGAPRTDAPNPGQPQPQVQPQQPPQPPTAA